MAVLKQTSPTASPAAPQAKALKHHAVGEHEPRCFQRMVQPCLSCLPGHACFTPSIAPRGLSGPLSGAGQSRYSLDRIERGDTRGTDERIEDGDEGRREAPRRHHPAHQCRAEGSRYRGARPRQDRPGRRHSGLLQKLIKSRQESVEIYDKAGRIDLATQEREEIAVIQTFLPQPLSAEEADAAISAAIAETGASSIKDMGRVIGVLRANYAGRMDIAQASAAVKAKLGG